MGDQLLIQSEWHSKSILGLPTIGRGIWSKPDSILTGAQKVLSSARFPWKEELLDFINP